MDPETLTYLLSGGHLSVPEREARGLWPHPPIPFADLVEHIVKEVELKKVFPGPWKNERGPGIVERKSAFQFVWLAYVEIGVARDELKRSVFRSAEAAARAYLHWNFNLPKGGSLDGWRIA